MIMNEIMSSTLCRLCQSEEGTIDLTENPDITNKILECTKIDINYPVTVSRVICDECSNKIHAFLEFLDMIHGVDKRLREKCCPDCGENCEDDLKEMAFHSCDFKEIELNHDDVSRDSSESNGEEQKFEGSFACNVCSENFLTDDDLNVHKKTHATFRCSWENCNAICRSAKSLQTHEMKHTGKRPFLCVACGKGFTTRKSLNYHEKIHSDVKAYTCEVCNIGFSVRSNLRAHERKHHENVRFNCSQCPRAFNTKYSLERHEKLHTGIREFQCQICPSAFYTNKELVKHQIYHQGLKQHKCDQCYKSFYEKHHLTIHLRSHSGERPYPCEVPGCGKSFAESYKLTRHQKAKHPV